MKLQRLHFWEKKKQEAEKLRDEQFHQYRPMVPQNKAVDKPARLVELPQPTGQTGTEDRSDRLAESVRPVPVSA